MSSTKNSKSKTIPYLCFGGILLFGIGIIYCIKQQYTAPLIFLGIALSDAEVNISFFKVWIAAGFVAIFIEMLFDSVFCILLRRLTVSIGFSILALFIVLIDYTKFGKSAEHSILITLTTCTWFVAKLFTLPKRISSFYNLVELKQKNKIAKIKEHFLELKAHVLGVILALILASFSTLILSSSLHKIDNIGLMLLWWTSFWIWFVFFKFVIFNETKYRYVPRQKMLYSGNYQELVIRLFEAGFILDKKIDNYYQFQANIFLTCCHTLLVEKRQGQYFIFGEEEIIKALSDDIGATCLKIDPVCEHAEIKENNDATKMKIGSVKS